ncbi:MAG: ANTAR domain-containing protein [Clostridia bacterium]|nr:ANTAR domain-containing protein [Clostridia bacterium]
MLEERKIIERAKGRLMDQLKLSESDAHYRIQKRSMDMGRRIVDIAREILENGVEIVN